MIDSMGKFTAIGMRVKVDENAIIVNTCTGNDTSDVGGAYGWTWCNPTNRIIRHDYHDVSAVSVECLWQGTKILKDETVPNAETLNGNWRNGKAKRPIGAYAGPGQPLITSPGEARRKIYVPAYAKLIAYWIENSEFVRKLLANAKSSDLPVYLRDWDIGRGLDQIGPMSHAWLLAMYLNNGVWPS